MTESMETLVEQVADGLRAVELVKFGIAEELTAKKLAGTWKEYVYPEGHERAGARPGSFRKFLEALAAEQRERGLKLSTGDLEELMRLYEWVGSMGGTVRDMAFLTQAGLKSLYTLHHERPLPEAKQHVDNAYQELLTYGKFHLPAQREPGKVTPILWVEEQPDDTVILKALGLVQDGVTYRNRFPTRLLHWLSKRLRAAVEIQETK